MNLHPVKPMMPFTEFRLSSTWSIRIFKRNEFHLIINDKIFCFTCHNECIQLAGLGFPRDFRWVLYLRRCQHISQIGLNSGFLIIFIFFLGCLTFFTRTIGNPMNYGIIHLYTAVKDCSHSLLRWFGNHIRNNPMLLEFLRGRHNS